MNEPSPKPQVENPERFVLPRELVELAANDFFASDVHKSLRESIVFSDQKAALLFTGVLAVLAYLHEKGVTRRWLIDPRNWLLADALAFVAVVGLVIGALCALSVVVPRFRGSVHGLVFWKTIASFPSREEYADRVIKLGASELTQAKLEDCYGLAQICRRKFQAVNLAIWSASIGLLAAVLYLAVA
ncbi:MAG: Pycsar system effector family protein [Candidatus Methylomirabilales bacterium]